MNNKNAMNNQNITNISGNTRSILYEDLEISSSDEDTELETITNDSSGHTVPNVLDTDEHANCIVGTSKKVKIPELNLSMVKMKKSSNWLEPESYRIPSPTKPSCLASKLERKKKNEATVQSAAKSLPRTKSCQKKNFVEDICITNTKKPNLKRKKNEVVRSSRISYPANKCLQVLPSKPGLIPNTISVVPVFKDGAVKLFPLNSFALTPGMAKQTSSRNAAWSTNPKTSTENDSLIEKNKSTLGSCLKNNTTTCALTSKKSQKFNSSIFVQDASPKTLIVLGGHSKMYLDNQNNLNNDDEDFQIARFTPLVINPPKSSSQNVKQVTKKTKTPPRSRLHFDKPMLVAKQSYIDRKYGNNKQVYDRHSDKSKKCSVTRLEPEVAGCIINEQGVLMWICPLCKGQDDGTAMIRCDKCECWYHFSCVGIEVAPPEEDKWFCLPCN